MGEMVQQDKMDLFNGALAAIRPHNELHHPACHLLPLRDHPKQLHPESRDA